MSRTRTLWGIQYWILWSELHFEWEAWECEGWVLKLAHRIMFSIFKNVVVSNRDCLGATLLLCSFPKPHWGFYSIIWFLWLLGLALCSFLPMITLNKVSIFHLSICMRCALEIWKTLFGRVGLLSGCKRGSGVVLPLYNWVLSTTWVLRYCKILSLILEVILLLVHGWVSTKFHCLFFKLLSAFLEAIVKYRVWYV